MTSPLQLPPLQQARLDEPTLDQLFSDLAACATVRSVQPRTHPSAPPVFLTVADARVGLKDGTLRGLQIRYRYEGKDWCDTLLRGQDGVRLVRICEDDISASIAAQNTSP
jgi:hypothetical protein